MTNNWGRWGDDDQAGALNLISPAKRLSALTIPTRGEVVSLGQDIKAAGVPMAKDGIRGFYLRPAHFMLYDGGDEASGSPARGDNYFSAEDYIGLRIHGVTTHVDGLAHGWKDNKLYNGFSRDEINSLGARKLGIENATNFVTRGVLFDVAKARGVTSLDIDVRIGIDDLLACDVPQLEPGDAVIIRTGWRNVYYTDPETYDQLAWPGVDLEAIKWLAAQDAAVIGADTVGVEFADPGFVEHGSQGHGMLLRDHGIYILELLDLEELSEKDVVEFLFMMAPLRICGATGSPVNPLAVL